MQKHIEVDNPKDWLSLSRGNRKGCDFSKSKNSEKIKPLLKMIERSQARSPERDGLTPKARKSLCEIIDLMDNNWVWLDMFCFAIPKENAKEYIMKHPQTMGEIEEANREFMNNK